MCVTNKNYLLINQPEFLCKTWLKFDSNCVITQHENTSSTPQQPRDLRQVT